MIINTREVWTHISADAVWEHKYTPTQLYTKCSWRCGKAQTAGEHVHSSAMATGLGFIGAGGRMGKCAEPSVRTHFRPGLRRASVQKRFPNWLEGVSASFFGSAQGGGKQWTNR